MDKCTNQTTAMRGVKVRKNMMVIILIWILLVMLTNLVVAQDSLPESVIWDCNLTSCNGCCKEYDSNSYGVEEYGECTCYCDDGYELDDMGENCVPQCPEHSHLVADDCECDDGYELDDMGENCVPQCPEHSHLVGDDCECDDGYELDDMGENCVSPGNDEDVPENHPPNALFSIKLKSPKNLIVNSTSSDPDGDTLTYSWYIDGEYNSEIGNSPHWTWENPESGEYNIKLIVEDGKGGSDEYSTEINVENIVHENHPPVASFNIMPQNPKTGDTIVGTSTSSDPDGDRLTHSWYFGSRYDSKIGNSTGWTLENLAFGKHTITLMVDDGKGGNDRYSMEINVAADVPENRPPNASFSITLENPKTNDVLVGTSTSSDPDGDTLTYSWYFDGEYDSNTGNSSYWTLENPKAGEHTIRLVVKDGKGGSDEYSLEINVETGDIENHPPSASFFITPENPKPEDTLVGTSTSSDPGGDTLTYSWYFDGKYDSNTGNSSDWTLENPEAGEHTIKLVVEDDKGGKDEQSIKINVGQTHCSEYSIATSRDALAALQMSVGKIETDLCYDVTGDGKVRSDDARDILKKAVKKFNKN